MPYLEMKGITKLYPDGLVANDAIDFSVEKNEIHAVVGENGAGKTTLMKILYGLEQPDAGTITLAGARVTIHSPLDREPSGDRHGPPALQAHPRLHRRGERGPGHRARRAGSSWTAAPPSSASARSIESHGFSMDPRARVLTAHRRADAAGGDRQDALPRRGAPHPRRADLGAHRAGDPQALRNPAQPPEEAGKTCIIITHKLQEVMEISDRVTVMRKGAVVAVRRTAEVDERRAVATHGGPQRALPDRAAEKRVREPVLELRDVTLKQRGGTGRSWTASTSRSAPARSSAWRV